MCFNIWCEILDSVLQLLHVNVVIIIIFTVITVSMLKCHRVKLLLQYIASLSSYIVTELVFMVIIIYAISVKYS